MPTSQTWSDYAGTFQSSIRLRFARVLPALKPLHGLNGSHACAALVVPRRVRSHARIVMIGRSSCARSFGSAATEDVGWPE